MPLYYDATKVKKRLHRWHLELSCEFLEALRRHNYFEREHTPGEPSELAEDDFTNEVIAEWTHVRRWLAEHAPHDFFRHRYGMSNEAHNVTSRSMGNHGHMCPPMFVLFEGVTSVMMDERDHARSLRDLRALIGLRTVAARAKMSADEVFGPEV